MRKRVSSFWIKTVSTVSKFVCSLFTACPLQFLSWLCSTLVVCCALCEISGTAKILKLVRLDGGSKACPRKTVWDYASQIVREYTPFENIIVWWTELVIDKSTDWLWYGKARLDDSGWFPLSGIFQVGRVVNNQNSLLKISVQFQSTTAENNINSICLKNSTDWKQASRMVFWNICKFCICLFSIKHSSKLFILV